MTVDYSPLKRYSETVPREFTPVRQKGASSMYGTALRTIDFRFSKVRYAGRFERGKVESVSG